MSAESSVLERIAKEVDASISQAEGSLTWPGAHSSHTSGHYSTGGHNSSVARVEGLGNTELPETEKKES